MNNYAQFRKKHSPRQEAGARSVRNKRQVLQKSSIIALLDGMS